MYGNPSNSDDDYYGYNYYNGSSDDLQYTSENLLLNGVYDMRGLVNLIPVVNGRVFLHINTYSINGGSSVFSVTNNNNTKFVYVEMIGQKFLIIIIM